MNVNSGHNWKSANIHVDWRFDLLELGAKNPSASYITMSLRFEHSAVIVSMNTNVRHLLTCFLVHVLASQQNHEQIRYKSLSSQVPEMNESFGFYIKSALLSNAITTLFSVVIFGCLYIVESRKKQHWPVRFNSSYEYIFFHLIKFGKEMTYKWNYNFLTA